MKKTELHNLVIEALDEFVNEAELKTGDNSFTIKVDVNKNPTKKGIKIQLIPKGDTVLVDPDEKIDVNEKVQSAMNQRLAKYDLQVNIDPDIKQATDNPNVLGYYIPLSQFKNLILKALKGK
jgi:hypothetical protein